MLVWLERGSLVVMEVPKMIVDYVRNLIQYYLHCLVYVLLSC